MSQQNSEDGVIRGTRKDLSVPDSPFFVDAHVDLPYFMMSRGLKPSPGELSEGDDAPFTIEKAERAGIGLFCTAIYCEDRFNGPGSVVRFKELLDFTKRLYAKVPVIRHNHDLRGLREGDQGTGTILVLENGDPLAHNIPLISELREEGVLMVGLTHAGKNRIADGSTVRYGGGITREGREVITALNENRLIIDVAHLHHRCFWQLLDLTDGTLVSTHTGITEAFDTPRNISLAHIKEIVDRGGMVGISFNPEMLSPDREATLDHVFAHIDTVVQRFGPRSVGIGSDLCGFDSVTLGLEDITRVGALMDIMLDHGYGREGVNGIMGGNWLGLYESYLEE
ncbi:MAG: membrane dipeptidase [Deltaproteobacteria bacterium]|nr:membrane dipeptidase [Deltaproteobacteria bacterium]